MIIKVVNLFSNERFPVEQAKALAKKVNDLYILGNRIEPIYFDFRGVRAETLISAFFSTFFNTLLDLDLGWRNRLLEAAYDFEWGFQRGNCRSFLEDFENQRKVVELGAFW